MGIDDRTHASQNRLREERQIGPFWNYGARYYAEQSVHRFLKID
jgi:hypothetical protein